MAPLTEAERKAHIELIKKIAAWSGWALAFLSLFLGGYVLNKFHLQLIDLQQENKRLKTKMENVQVGHTELPPPDRRQTEQRPNP